MKQHKNSTMSRLEKLNLIQAVKDGKLTVEDLQPPQIYFFHKNSKKNGEYELNGKIFNETEYQAFCDRLKKKRNNSLILNNGKASEEDRIITLIFPEKKEDSEE